MTPHGRCKYLDLAQVVCGTSNTQDVPPESFVAKLPKRSTTHPFLSATKSKLLLLGTRTCELLGLLYFTIECRRGLGSELQKGSLKSRHGHSIYVLQPPRPLAYNIKARRISTPLRLSTHIKTYQSSPFTWRIANCTLGIFLLYIIRAFFLSREYSPRVKMSTAQQPVPSSPSKRRVLGDLDVNISSPKRPNTLKTVASSAKPDSSLLSEETRKRRFGVMAGNATTEHEQLKRTCLDSTAATEENYPAVSLFLVFFASYLSANCPVLTSLCPPHSNFNSSNTPLTSPTASKQPRHLRHLPSLTHRPTTQQ